MDFCAGKLGLEDRIIWRVHLRALLRPQGGGILATFSQKHTKI